MAYKFLETKQATRDFFLEYKSLSQDPLYQEWAGIIFNLITQASELNGPRGLDPELAIGISNLETNAKDWIIIQSLTRDFGYTTQENMSCWPVAVALTAAAESRLNELKTAVQQFTMHKLKRMRKLRIQTIKDTFAPQIGIKTQEVKTIKLVQGQIEKVETTGTISRKAQDDSSRKTSSLHTETEQELADLKKLEEQAVQEVSAEINEAGSELGASLTGSVVPLIVTLAA